MRARKLILAPRGAYYAGKERNDNDVTQRDFPAPALVSDLQLLKQTRNIGFEDIGEERELSESLEGGEWQSVDDLEDAKAEARRYAEATVRKDRRMNIRITERDRSQS